MTIVTINNGIVITNYIEVLDGACLLDVMFEC